MNFDEKLAAAEKAPVPHKDVPVCLDSNLSAQREALLEALEAAEEHAAADQRLAAPAANTEDLQNRLEQIEAAAKDSLVTLRFYKMPGNVRDELTSHHPVRPDVAIDRHFGYNLDSLCLAAAGHVDRNGESYGFNVDGGTETPLTAAQWARLFATISGSEVSDIKNAIWALNEAEPARRLDALVKGFGAAARSETK